MLKFKEILFKESNINVKLRIMKFKKTVYILLPLLISAFLIVIYFISLIQKKTTYLESAILGGEYLLEHIEEDGRYIYKYDPINKTVSDDYNILRHAGTTYSLLELYEITGKSELLNAAEKALDFLVENIQPCPNIQEAKCLVENEKVKLGGNGLAILAMSKYMQVTNSNRYLKNAQDLAFFITSTQSEDGEYAIHKMNINDGTVDDFISMYYPGEAMFALSRLYQLDKNREWIESAHKAAKWIIEVRDAEKSSEELEHDHWFLYSLNELYIDNNDPTYLVHSKKIVDNILAAQHKAKIGIYEDWNGGYYSPPRSTPTATRSEGLYAAFKLFMNAKEYEYAKKTREALKDGIDFQLRTQITKKKIKELGFEEKILGGFHASLTDYTIRIDYIQHNISAILGYLDVKDVIIPSH
jgi:hypothetical protein